ncbi:MAG: hypothetical protein JWP87_2419 [Labilithrix sp.]|nr:hypothetical protein [Labilithrix sp.]
MHLYGALTVTAAALVACSDKVPTDVVQSMLRIGLAGHASGVASQLCGVKVHGIADANVTRIVLAKDGKSGTAHVSGAPTSTTPLPAGAPATCEGDVRFAFKRSKVTASGWSAVYVKLASEDPEDKDACLRYREPGESPPPGCER